MINSIRGFNDILPPETSIWQHIEKEAREIFEAYGFSEIRVPIVEKTGLFSRSIGETTDIVEKEMYTFEDRHGEAITLRPEGTAPVVRAYIEHKIYGNDPVAKFYYLGPMFRYERPQKGRFRQFHQIGAEVFGIDDPKADAETLEMLVCLFQKLGLEGITLQINSLGCKECRPLYKEKLLSFLQDKKSQLCHDCQRRFEINPLRTLDCKSPGCIEITAHAPSILDAVCDGCKTHFEKVKEYLALSQVDFSLNQKMVRGLDYYIRTTFEITALGLGSQNAVAAGGRYDGLVKSLDGPDTPGFGFAIGMERLVMLAKDRGQQLAVSNQPLVFIAILGDKAEKEAVGLIKRIRTSGIRLERDYSSKSIKSQMKRADKLGARYVLILGDDELSSCSIIIKNMQSGEQEKVALDRVEDRMKELLRKSASIKINLDIL
ncbi:MAG: histidine--tRNA ligase [Deltaproteobacteria bacterium]|nr:histidine--tRNA ligase [Deltaproteobacteria bacterium]